MERIDKDAAVSCSLNDEEFRERRALARQTLVPHVIKFERIENILTFFFKHSNDLRKAVEEFVGLEQQCCEFLTFKIVDNEGGQPTALRISGPPEASATIDIFASGFEARRS